MATALKDDSKSMMETIPVYEFIKDYIPFIPVKVCEKGAYLFRSENLDTNVYYILEGCICRNQ